MPKKKTARKTRKKAAARKAAPTHTIEMRAVSSLTPYANNARQHSPAQVDKLAASITEWGWTTPVLIDPDGEIIAGHGRILAAAQLNMEEVPCIVAQGWTKAQRRAYVIADNQLGLESTWDDGLLGYELDNLDDQGFEMNLIGLDFIPMPELEPVPDPARPPVAPPAPTQPSTAPQELRPDSLDFGGATALERASGPMRMWADLGHLGPATDAPLHLDFGCGKERTAANRFDPFHAPNYDLLRDSWEYVTCNYVLNVQPSDHLILQIIGQIHGLLSKNSHDARALFAVWNDETNGPGLRKSSKGWQNIKHIADWIGLLCTFFVVEPIVTSGTYFAFVCKPLPPTNE